MQVGFYKCNINLSRSSASVIFADHTEFEHSKLNVQDTDKGREYFSLNNRDAKNDRPDQPKALEVSGPSSEIRDGKTNKE